MRLLVLTLISLVSGTVMFLIAWFFIAAVPLSVTFLILAVLAIGVLVYATRTGSDHP